MAGLGHQAADLCWDAKASGRASESSTALAAAERRTRLTRTIESEIIPRLLLAHGAARETALPLDVNIVAPGADEVEEFANLLLAGDIPAIRAFVDDLQERGASRDVIFLDLLAPAARYLGDLWKEDRCDFMDVTLGLSRLQQLLRDLTPFFDCGAVVPESGRRLLLLPAPGEQHTFGVYLVEDFFRRAGWEVWVENPGTPEAVVEFLRGMWFGVVGLSVSGERLLDSLAPVIRSIRQESLNRGVGIMVGGNIFVDDPGLAVQVGADATARDARHAVQQAQALLGLVIRQR